MLDFRIRDLRSKSIHFLAILKRGLGTSSRFNMATHSRSTNHLSYLSWLSALRVHVSYDVQNSASMTSTQDFRRRVKNEVKIGTTNFPIRNPDSEIPIQNPASRIQSFPIQLLGSLFILIPCIPRWPLRFIRQELHGIYKRSVKFSQVFKIK
jgi:hypothetical protein